MPIITSRVRYLPLLMLSSLAAWGQIPGAAADAIVVYDANMTAGRYTLTTTTSTPFHCPTDAGKAIAVYGAGPQYSSPGPIFLVESIPAVPGYHDRVVPEEQCRYPECALGVHRLQSRNGLRH